MGHFAWVIITCGYSSTSYLKLLIMGFHAMHIQREPITSHIQYSIDFFGNCAWVIITQGCSNASDLELLIKSHFCLNHLGSCHFITVGGTVCLWGGANYLVVV